MAVGHVGAPRGGETMLLEADGGAAGKAAESFLNSRLGQKADQRSGST